MQELMKKKQEIDRLYQEAKAMELTVNAAVQNTIDKALASLGEILDQVGDDFGVFHVDAYRVITLSRQGAANNLSWVLQVDSFLYQPILYVRKSDHRWDCCNTASVKCNRAVAETIMSYWPKFMELVREELERQIKAEMQKKLDEVGRMVDFLQRAEKFKI